MRRPLPLLAAAGAGAAEAAGAWLAEPRLARLWRPARAPHFAATTPAEAEAFARLVPALLDAAAHAGAPPPALVELAASVGFTLAAWGPALWALTEAPGAERGAGAYVVRTGPAREDVVQAPHADHDLGTGVLAAALFCDPGPGGLAPRALAVNTAHRHAAPAAPGLEAPADVAHNPGHLFTLTTEALARALHAPRVLQVHGFGPRSGREGLTAVVSAGTHAPTAWARAAHASLEALLGPGVRLFPEGVRVLGGTTNAQGHALRRLPRASFLHLELSAEARRALASPEAAARLSEALFAPAHALPKE